MYFQKRCNLETYMKYMYIFFFHQKGVNRIKWTDNFKSPVRLLPFEVFISPADLTIAFLIFSKFIIPEQRSILLRISCIL